MGKIKLKNLFVITIMVSSLLCITTTYSIGAIDVIITDGIEDVYSYDSDGNITLITDSPEIEINNLDITQATYTLEGIQVTLTLQVNGIIQDLGNLFDFETIEDLENLTIIAVYYQFDLTTSSEVYTIIYSNKTCNFTSDTEKRNLPSSDFSVEGNTLTVKFTLENADETYESLDVESSYMKFSLIENTAVLLMDMAPNPPLTVDLGDIPATGIVGDPIQLNARVEAGTGLPPYETHWDFGDNTESDNVLNLTHIYSKPGVYSYIFTATDSAGATASAANTITIKDKKKAFLFGTCNNIYSEGEYITVEVSNLRVFILKPFQYIHYVDGQNVIVSNEYTGRILFNRFLIGMFSVVVDSEITSKIAYTTDVLVTNTAMLRLQRLLS